MYRQNANFKPGIQALSKAKYTAKMLDFHSFIQILQLD